MQGKKKKNKEPNKNRIVNQNQYQKFYQNSVNGNYKIIQKNSPHISSKLFASVRNRLNNKFNSITSKKSFPNIGKILLLVNQVKKMIQKK